MIINTAAMTQVDQCETDRRKCWDLNVLAVAHLIEASEKYQSHLVHLSTDFIFDGEKGMYKEDDVPNPVSIYGESKVAAEKAVMNSQVKWGIARTILVYGIAHDMSRSNIVLWVKKSLEEGKQIQVIISISTLYRFFALHYRAPA